VLSYHLEHEEHYREGSLAHHSDTV